MPDSYMTASSMFSTSYAPYHGRLNNEPGSGHNGAWCTTVADAATNASYIQVTCYVLLPGNQLFLLKVIVSRFDNEYSL